MSQLSVHKYVMTSYPNWPPLFGIKIVTEKSEDDFYLIPKSQVLVFPFKLDGYAAVRIDAGHTSFYNNQQGTILGWASDEINGRSIASNLPSSLARIPLPGDGFSWLLHDIGVDPSKITPPDGAYIVPQTHWIRSNQQYFMCFQNQENKDNGLFLRFTYQDI